MRAKMVVVLTRLSLVATLSLFSSSVAGAAPDRGRTPEPNHVSATPSTLYSVAQWGSLGAGIVTFGAGAALFALGVNDESTIEEADRDPQGRINGITQSQAAQLQDDSESKRTSGVLAMGIGAALVGTGIVLWLLAEEPLPEPGPTDKSGPEVRPYGFRLLPMLVPAVVNGQPGLAAGAEIHF